LTQRQAEGHKESEEPFRSLQSDTSAAHTSSRQSRMNSHVTLSWFGILQAVR
jgi:hypothetical protein